MRHGEEPSRRAASVFAQYLASKEAGGEPHFEALFREH